MATATRLAAALSVALASALVILTGGGGGIVALLGWTSVAMLAAGLVLGHRGAIAALGVGIVLRMALQSAFGVQPDMGLWLQALLLTLSIEAGTMSFTLRNRPADPLTVMVRGVGTALVVAGLVEILNTLALSSDTNGTLVRVAGIAALVLAAGWVVRTWRQSGLV